MAGDGSEGDGNSSAAVVSAKGQVVAFESRASNLVAGDTNGVAGIFVRDLVAGMTSRVSVARDEPQASATSAGVSISGDGCFVAISAFADDLVVPDANFVDDVMVHDRQTGATAMVSRRSDGSKSHGPSLAGHISGDGRVIVFPSSDPLIASDVNGMEDSLRLPEPSIRHGWRRHCRRHGHGRRLPARRRRGGTRH